MDEESYRVELTNPAERDLRRMRSAAEPALGELVALESAPQLGQMLTGQLSEVRSLHWRVGKTDYRAAYVVLAAERVCLVFLIGSRENFYRDAGRRWEAVKKTL